MTSVMAIRSLISHDYGPLNKFSLAWIPKALSLVCLIQESIPHLSWQCDISSRFWKDVQDHVLKKDVTVSMKDVILGILDTDNSIYNVVILHAKQYISNARCNDHRLNVTAYKKQLQHIYTIEKYKVTYLTDLKVKPSMVNCSTIIELYYV